MLPFALVRPLFAFMVNAPNEAPLLRLLPRLTRQYFVCCLI